MTSVTYLGLSGSKWPSWSCWRFLVYGVPFLQPASEGEAVCGEFSEQFQIKKKALHLLLVHRCVGLPSRAWPQQPHCSYLKGSFDIHLAWWCCSPFSQFWIHSTIFFLWNMKQPWSLLLSTNFWRFPVCAHQVAVLQRHEIFHSACWKPPFWSRCKKWHTTTPCHFKTQEHDNIIPERERAQRQTFSIIYDFVR